MSAFLYRLGRISARHPFRVLGLWLVAAVAILALQRGAGARSTTANGCPASNPNTPPTS